VDVDDLPARVADGADGVGLGVDAPGGEGGVGGGHVERVDAPVQPTEEEGALGLGGVVGNPGVTGCVDHRPHPYAAAEVDEDDVHRTGEGGVDVDAAAGVFAGVVAHPTVAVAGDAPARGAVEGRPGVDALAQGGQVDEGLESRARLATSTAGGVELGGGEVEPAEEAAHRPRPGLDAGGGGQRVAGLA
jgi:hypothetical protein